MPALDTLIFTAFSQSCAASGGQLNFTLRTTGGTGENTFQAWELRKADGETVKEGSRAGTQNAFTVTGIPDGSYTLYATCESGFEAQRQVTISCTPAPPPPSTDPGQPTTPEAVYVDGCTDPEADNYDPSATRNNGSCVYSPRLSMEVLPELVANGAPVLVTLLSAPLGRVMPAPARVLLYVQSSIAEGTTVTVNGSTFAAGSLTGADRFTDAATLCEVMQLDPVLAAGYTITQPSGNTVQLVALVEGRAGNLVLTTSDAAAISWDIVDGVNRYRSQLREAWGCYVEVWCGCGSDFGGTTQKSTAVRAARFETRYRTDNRYTFDIADALRAYTAHRLALAPGQVADRMVSYFVRFGEIYADFEGGLRRVRNSYESSVLWALEAVEVPAELVPGVRVLSTQPQRRVGPSINYLPLLVSKVALPTLQVQVTETNAAGGSATSTRTPMASVSAGGAQVVALALAADTVRAVVRLGGVVLFTQQAQRPGAKLLRFANRQGGIDAYAFEGVAERGNKRTAATYGSPTGEAVASVEVGRPQRLYSTLLDRETYEWLCTELASTPSAWLSSTPVTISDFDTSADELKNEFTVAVELTTAPVSGLKN